MNKWLNHRFFYLIAFAVIGILLGGAQYLQTYKGVNPCPLCILQRITFGALGIIFLIGIIVSSKRSGQLIIGILSSVLSIAGIGLSGRQVWLQYFLPSNAGANCEVSLQYMMNVLPFDQVLAKIFQGSSGCSQIGWEFLGFSLAQWSLAFFILFFIFSLWQLRRNN